MIFIPLIIIAVLIVNYYIGWHGAYLLTYFSIPMPTMYYWVLFWLLVFSIIFGRLIPGPFGRLLKVIGSYYLAIVQFSLLLLLLMDLAAWIFHMSGFSSAVYVPMLSLVYFILLALLMIIGSYNAWSPVKRTYHIDIDKKAGTMKKLRIAVASDLHLGNIVGNRHLQKLVTKINALTPDLILFPGDVLDDVIEPFMRNQMAQKLKQLKAPLGIFAVLGNHEYIGGNIDQYVEEMKSIGIPVLRDQVVSIEDSLYIAGRKDKMAERRDPDGRLSFQELFHSVDDTLPIIAMDHQPYQFDQAVAAGVDLLLCGHTHRGQIAPNHLVTRKLFELDWGYLLKEGMHVIVSSGFGSWGPPIRLGSRSEYIELIVRFRG